jgi:hypothetical protein
MPTPDGTGPYATSTGQELISIERARQLHQKGITVQRDDATHRAGALAHHAACYEEYGADSQPPPDWPDDLDWRPQRNDVAALVRAGALYQAEIDRLQHRLRRIIFRIDQKLQLSEDDS